MNEMPKVINSNTKISNIQANRNHQVLALEGHQDVNIDQNKDI